ncbi:MAG TPA: hypothetical protein VFF06_13195 [Polyangia bacterium]|nr:hypothetical protein [Polyangia bacterium]
MSRRRLPLAALSIAASLAACAHPAGERRALVQSAPRTRADRALLRPGTLLVARLDRQVGTDVSKEGDRWTARVVNRVVDEHGREVLPPGTRLAGRVVTVEKGFGELQPRLELAADQLRAGCHVRQIAARVTYAEGEESNRHPPGDPVRSAVIAGLFFGGVLLGPPGAMIGGTMGVGGGTAREAAARLVDARLLEGARVVIELEQPLYAGELTSARAC